MNKFLLHAVLLVMLLSCSRNEEQYLELENQDTAMQFAISFSDIDTRSATSIHANDLVDGMSVGFYAFMTNYDAPHTKEMRAENVKLTYHKASNAWVYDDGVEPIKWDFNYTYDRFSFYVYYPYDEQASNVHFDMHNASFSIDYDAAKDQDVDVMIAQLENISYPMGGVVSINLKHILSLIAFKTDFSNPIEEIQFCAAPTYKTMPKRGNAKIVNGAIEWTIDEFYTSAYAYSLGNTEGNYALIIPQKIPNKGDLYFSMSYNDGKTPIDNGAQAPQGMAFEAGRMYTFKYKGSYFDYDEENNTLVIDIDEFNKQSDKKDFSSIDKIIDKVLKEGATLKCTGTVDEDPYLLLLHIIQRAQGVENIDLSGVTFPTNSKIPYKLFQDKVTQSSLKKLKLPVMDDTNFHSALLKDCHALEEIEFAEGTQLTKLQYNFCSGCTSLKKVNLEVLNSLTVVSQNSFIGCTALEQVALPASVISIEETAFKDCTVLKKINIPASLKTIANKAFANCRSLYSYDQDGQAAGFVLDPRPDNSMITVNYQAFMSTYVMPLINNKKWWTGTHSEGQIFITPM